MGLTVAVDGTDEMAVTTSVGFPSKATPCI